MADQQASKLCVGNCGFYGTSATNNMCSLCFRLHSAPTKQELQSPPQLQVKDDAQPSIQIQPGPQIQSRCSCCRKKTGLFGFTCRCGRVFCSLHRYSDAHYCSFDYQAAGRLQIARDNPRISRLKLEKI